MIERTVILSEAELACKGEADGFTYYVMSVQRTQIRWNL